jgi:hypothetical protein
MSCAPLDNLWLCVTAWHDLAVIEAWGAMGVLVAGLASLLVALRRSRRDEKFLA